MYADSILLIQPLIELTGKRIYLLIAARKISAERLHNSGNPEAEFGAPLSTKGPITVFGCERVSIFRLRVVETLDNTVVRVFLGSGVTGCELPDVLWGADASVWI